MPQEPKKRHSRQRQGKRRAAIKLSIKETMLCANCSQPVLPHTICKNCGYYKGKMVIDVERKKKLKEAKSASGGKKETNSA